MLHKNNGWWLLLALFSANGVQAAEGAVSPEKAEAKQTKVADDEKGPTFDVYEYQVQGNTVLDNSKVEEAVYDYLGPGKTIDDVEKARAALEKVYQDAGYLTVSINIPQQEVSKGIVKLEVVEGRVDRLRVKDAHYYSLGVIKERVAEFEEGKVPNFKTAQQQLATVNRGQNRSVTPVLRPGKTPGKVEVDLKVQDQLPFHGSVELNDRYSSNTTHTRLNANARYENLWDKDHSVSVSVQVSPEKIDESKVLSGTYVIPTLGGDYFAAYGVLSRSNVSAVGDVSVIGNGNIVGARYIHPLPSLSNFYHSLTAGVDYKDFKESVVLLGADGFKNPISYTLFDVGYDGTYMTEQSQTQANIGMNISARALGNSEQEFANKRYNARPNFIALHTDVKHTQKLPKDWSIQGRVAGQVATGPLISAEQFSVGGADSVRGYTESNSLGDNGVFVSLELRTPSFQKYLNDYLKEAHAFTFVDAGYVKSYSPLPQQIVTYNLQSVGLGVKFKGTKGVFGDLDFAHALHDAGTVKDGDERLHFRLGYEW